MDWKKWDYSENPRAFDTASGKAPTHAICQVSEETIERQVSEIEDFSLANLLPYLVRCWSLWDSLPASTPVLYMPGLPAERQTSLSAFLDTLHHQMPALQVTTEEPTDEMLKTSVWGHPAVWQGPRFNLYLEGYAMRTVNQANALQKLVWNDLKVEESSSCKDSAPVVVALVALEQVGNLELIRDSLHERFETYGDAEIRVISMQDLEWADSIRALANVSIVVTPHADDLATSLLFLPKTATGIVESFPPGYFEPQRHGTLAAMRQFEYISVSTTNPSQKRGKHWKPASALSHKNDPYCLPVDETLQAVEEMLKRRRTRCSDSMPTSPAQGENEPINFSSTEGCLSLGPADIVKTDFPVFPKTEDVYTVIKEESYPEDFKGEKAAVCEIQNVGYWKAFPHTMQQLARCASFWMEHQSYQPVLFWPGPEGPPAGTKRRFTSGMREFFRKGPWKVNEIKISEENIPKGALIAKANHIQDVVRHPQEGIALSGPEQADIFRQDMYKYLEIPDSARAGCPKSTGATRPVKPRIGLLSRSQKYKRSILNADFLAERLQNLSETEVQVHYFEDSSFADQISFMSSVDILIASHGAQLTSINFMPKCGAIVEAMPPGYNYPAFFGPLAASAGLEHYSVYAGLDEETEWQEMGVVSHPIRVKSRKGNMCVPIDSMVEHVQKLADNWRSCCETSLARVESS